MSASLLDSESTSRVVRTLLVVALITLVWMALRWPTPAVLAIDGDWVHQLGGANQILHGEYPFVDWHTDYGPLRYYPSALAQWLLGACPLADLCLVSAAYSLAYAVLFRLMWIAGGSRVIAALLLFVALVLAPRLYKYYAVLGPVVCLWAAWREIERPSPRSLWLLAAAVAATALFRADFGAFTGLGAAVAVASRPGPASRPALRLAQLAALVAVWAAPWLIWLAWRGGLGTYIADTLINGPRHASGMALPFPSFDGTKPLAAPANATFLLFVSFYALPPLALVAALWPGVCRAVAERRRLATAAVMAQAVLMHAAHRSDYTHLLQAIALCFVLCAWFAGRIWSAAAARRGRATAWAIAATVVLGGVLMVGLRAAMGMSGWPSPNAGAGLRAWRVHAMPRDALLAQLTAENPADTLVQAIQYVRRCTEAGDHLIALPPLIGAYYFSDRRFGGAQPAWSPGFFSTEADQQRWIDTVRRQHVPLVLGDGSRMLDNREDRLFAAYSARIIAYIDSAYVEIGRFGAIPVRALRTADTPQPWPNGLPPPCPPRRDAAEGGNPP
ncbi:MAG: hypothetical protein ABI629_02620 [bacterium]